MCWICVMIRFKFFFIFLCTAEFNNLCIKTNNRHSFIIQDFCLFSAKIQWNAVKLISHFLLLSVCLLFLKNIFKKPEKLFQFCNHCDHVRNHIIPLKWEWSAGDVMSPDVRHFFCVLKQSQLWGEFFCSLNTDVFVFISNFRQASHLWQLQQQIINLSSNYGPLPDDKLGRASSRSSILPCHRPLHCEEVSNLWVLEEDLHGNKSESFSVVFA